MRAFSPPFVGETISHRRLEATGKGFGLTREEAQVMKHRGTTTSMAWLIISDTLRSNLNVESWVRHAP